MSNTRWILFVLFFTVLNFTLLGLVNYIIDPFKVFGSNVFPYQVQLNERFVKIEHLKKNHHKFNAYLFGSSRIGTTDPKLIEKYVPNSKFYNFTLSSANLHDYEMHLAFFIKEKYEINTLYLQLDLDDMSDYGQDKSNYLRKLHPEVTNDLISLYYLKYLFGFFPINTHEKINNNLENEKTKRYQLHKGTWTLDKKELELKRNCQEYVERVSTFNIKNRRTKTYTTVKPAMKSLKKIIDLCAVNNIKLYVFTTPHNQNKMDTFILDDYENYIRDISKITDFYDFTPYSSVSKNNCNYYEMSHYRPQVARLIAGRIFKDKSIKVPNDFGKFIKKGSLN